MSLTRCALCDGEITEQNDSEEHVIPNSIGGRKKVKGFICEDCNNKSGREWYADLAHQLNPLSLFLVINRERGKVPSQTFNTTGEEKIKLHPDGKMSYDAPLYSENKIGEKVHVGIKARSVREVEKMLEGIKRKYPQIDYDEVISNAKKQSLYLSDMIEFNLSLGGPKAGRSIVKSAMALAVESGVNPKDCEHAREYLLNEHGEACFGYYYEKDLLINRPDGIPLHCIFVKGNPNTKQLLGYAEFFGFQRMVICLSSKYDGKEFINSHAIDPIEGAELDLMVDLGLTSEDIRASYNYEKIDYGLIKAAIGRVISRGQQASFEREKDRVIDQAIKYALSNCVTQEGETLTPEHIKQISRLIMEKLEPFLVHHLSQNISGRRGQ